MSVAAPADLRRDVRIIGLVGSAHFVSHFFQLVLPPLFPLLKGAFGVPYVALGLMMSLSIGASGISQTGVRLSRGSPRRAAHAPGRHESRRGRDRTRGAQRMVVTIATVLQVRRHALAASARP